MRQSSGLLGLIGIILLVFAGIDLALTRAAGNFDLVYITVHGVAGFLALTAYLSTGLENLRSFLGKRSTKYGTSTVLASLFFVGILAALNFLSARYHRSFDLTEAGVFSLSPQSEEVVKGLTKDLRMEAFVEAGVSPELRDLFDSYREASTKVTYRLIDPDREPELAEGYGITTYNTVRLAYGDATSMVTQPSEENLTNAIIKLSRASRQTLCVIEGHGESDIDDAQSARGMSQAKAALENESYEVKKVLLASMEKVPPDCSIVMVAGPVKPYLQHEIEALDAYIRSGGRTLFLLAPRRSEEFVDLLAHWGVRLGTDVVVDQVVRLFQGPALGLTPLVDDYDATHEITRALRGRTIFPMTRSVTADGADKPGLEVTEIVKTSPSSWAETDVDGIFDRQEAALDEPDQKGPVSIAAAVDIDLSKVGVPDGGEARMVVFGSSEFADNQHLDGTYFNRDLFLNAAGWLVGQSDLLSIRSRTLRASRVNFSQDEGTIIFYLSVLVIPEILLVAGLAVWWRRE